MKLTAEQQAAVDLRGRSVMVSAAAGAGKTRVLVERLMAYVTEDGRNIDDFMVVTYTRAAAGELRARIFARLKELLDGDEGNGFLKEQLTRVYTARIGTLDAYCREVILNNAEAAGLPNGYRTADSAELEILYARVMEETLDLLYERAGGDREDEFWVCAETYGDERGDYILSELILHIWQKTRCHADPMGWLAEKARAFPDEGWQEVLTGTALCIAEAFLRDYQTAGCGIYEEAREQDLRDLERLCAALRGGSWDEAAAAAGSCEFVRLRSAPKGAALDRESEEFRELRGRWKKALSGRIRELVYDPPEKHMREAEELKPLVTGLCGAVGEFDRALAAEKARLSVLEFTDVQRIALKLLQDAPPARFVEILADEVQDINPLQDAIITALSRGGENIFYVGDVRQSIYRFQMAEPEIFVGKLAGAACKVTLRENFRSGRRILDAVNHVFSRIDCPEVGVLGEEEFLINEKSADGEAPVDLLVPGEKDEEAEAERVAARLRELVESGEARAEDCVILLRSYKSRMGEYAAALKREGLDCAVPQGGGYFNRPEILVMISALEAVGNARNDVPLISVLRSPAVGCTPDELAELRVLADGPLYGCLELSDNPKIQAFLEMFGAWREIAAELEPFALAARVMADCELPRKVSAAACENLLLLPEVLRDYRGDLRGLPDWLRKQERGGEGVSANAAHGGGVRVMSVHSAKGLEFPVVVVAGLSRRLNLQDQNRRALAHPRLGLGLKRREGYSDSPTPAYRAVQAVMDGETRAEELRLLYVAMTRAEKRLILSVDERPAGEPGREVWRGDLILHSNTGAWLLRTRDTAWNVIEGAKRGEPCGRTDTANIEVGVERQERQYEDGWAYPHLAATGTPSKMTATGLKGRYPDEQAQEGAAEWRKTAALSATERGAAAHLFLQFTDFEKCTQQGGVEAEVGRLLLEKMLTAEQAESIDKEAMVRFFDSERGRALPTARGLRREQKFSMLIGDGDIPGLELPAGEKVLLQGVIDCFYETDRGMALIDFKTDRVAPGEEDARAERYRPQAEAYAAALAAMSGKPVAERVLVFLATGREVYL
jgi:ATP-dependent helicase/nuclease subunit A